MLLSIHSDYVNYILRPVAVDRTEWNGMLFHPDTLANPDNNIRDDRFWDLTNRRDWDIMGRAARRRPRRYAQGRIPSGASPRRGIEYRGRKG